MSRNVELMRNGLEAFSSGDLDRAVAEMSPEIEWHVAFHLPDLPADKKVFRGREEVRTLFEAFRSVWDELTVEIEEIHYDVAPMFLARVRFRGRGGVSGVEVDRVLYYVAEVENDMLRVLRPFDELEEARAAARLEDD
jgi:ketosteroid isomerase-like protein